MNRLTNKKTLKEILAAYDRQIRKDMGFWIKYRPSRWGDLLPKEFVTPLSITSLSQGKVYEDLFSSESESEMDHISLSRWADLIIVVPATANTISKMSNGLTDDLASTVLLASNKKIFIVPAMNVRMWDHPSNKKNIIKLREYGYSIIGPEIGDMACGEYGEGKMTEPSDILLHIENYLSSLQKNKKYKALVTAGPTREYLDPVRYLSLIHI